MSKVLAMRHVTTHRARLHCDWSFCVEVFGFGNVLHVLAEDWSFRENECSENYQWLATSYIFLAAAHNYYDNGGCTTSGDRDSVRQGRYTSVDLGKYNFIECDNRERTGSIISL